MVCLYDKNHKCTFPLTQKIVLLRIYPRDTAALFVEWKIIHNFNIYH